jgi:hypothetical protein
LDPKSCAIRWGSKRMDCKLPVRTLAFARLSSALTAAAKRKVTLVVIDNTPVLESPAALAAVKTADLTIVPKAIRIRHLGSRGDWPQNELHE